jgi:hypothetical protein
MCAALESDGELQQAMHGVQRLVTKTMAQLMEGGLSDGAA